MPAIARARLTRLKLGAMNSIRAPTWVARIQLLELLKLGAQLRLQHRHSDIGHWHSRWQLYCSDKYPPPVELQQLAVQVAA